MAESVVSLAVKRLGDLLTQEANFLHGVSGKVEQMRTELKLMQSYLEDADKRQDEDKRVQAVVSEIREVAYDAENVIETFVLKVESRRGEGFKNAVKRYSSIIGEAVELDKVGSDIETIKGKICNLTRSLQTYGIASKREGDQGTSSSARGMQQRELRRSYSHVVEDFTVGLEEDVKILVTQLVNEGKHCRVASICGMGGLGKTTLAKKIYHHTDIRHHFDGFAWASISQQCQARDVWEGILFKLISPSTEHRKEIKKMRVEELVKKLYQVQLKKKCLVILDDIWTTEAWDSLSPAFPVGKAGSKMLLTTRNKAVALHMDPRGYLHEPGSLDEEKSWELLKKKALPEKDDPGYRIDTEMEQLGRKMAGRCKGLPLAIIVLGGLLATKHTLNEWNMVHENIKLYLRRGKGSEQQHSGGVFEVLALSYHELPYQYKSCFLHLGHFPEDYDIPTKKLVRIWVAEGIVSPMQYELEGEETLEDVAERYLGELIHRCMVQVGVRGSTGRVKTCRLHDLMRDLSVFKANQENFLRSAYIYDGNKSTCRVPDGNNSSCQVHRLAIYLGQQTWTKFSWVHERTSSIRSLLFFSTHRHSRISQEIESKFSDFKLLKVLDLERCRMSGKLLRVVGNFIHLRYLSLCFDDSTKLPSSIGNLRCLQTLILEDWDAKVRVPNVIWKMERLKYLYLPPNIKQSSGKLRLGDLSDLQTLQHFDVRRFDVAELAKLTDLKKLGIKELENNKKLEEILTSSSVILNRLHSLKILVSYTIDFFVTETNLRKLVSSCHHLYKLYLQLKMEKLPQYDQFPPNLTKLTLVRSELNEDPMATLEKLPNLSILHLSCHAFIQKEMVCSSKGFPRLKSLVLDQLHYLEKWHVSEEAMPNLCKLVIKECSEVKMVPDGLRFITTLRELEIVKMPGEFQSRLQMVNKGGGEDLYKVKHVPFIIFK